MREPSGDQAGSASSPGPRTSGRRPLPSAVATTRSASPGRPLCHTTWRPPGAHAGLRSAFGCESAPYVAGARVGDVHLGVAVALGDEGDPVAVRRDRWIRVAGIQEGELDAPLRVGQHGSGRGRACGNERRERALRPCAGGARNASPAG